MIFLLSLNSMSFEVGKFEITGSIFALWINLSYFCLSLGEQKRMLRPFCPALPVLPLLWISISEFCGKSAWITISKLIKSIPLAATSVATQILHLLFLIDWRALNLSFWLNAPDRETAENPLLSILV